MKPHRRPRHQSSKWSSFAPPLVAKCSLQLNPEQNFLLILILHRLLACSYSKSPGISKGQSVPELMQPDKFVHSMSCKCDIFIKGFLNPFCPGKASRSFSKVLLSTEISGFKRYIQRISYLMESP